MINVTKTFLPPIEEYTKRLEKIWESRWLTNNGPNLLEFETKLQEYFGVKNVVVVSNATLGLQIAIKALNINNEIITTPFSYVATTSSIVWEKCKPVFADIESKTLNINPSKIAKVVNKKTEAILATHVYGNPCDVEKISDIAKKRKLKVIYDAAHTFGIEYKGRSLASYGDVSVVSFHAAKLFHTVEGGALVTDNDEVANRARYLRNFGHDGQENFCGEGINAKMSELHAAMGLTILPYVESIIEKNKSITKKYDRLIDWTKLVKPKLRKGTKYNYSYYPVIFKNKENLLSARDRLNAEAVYPRRYFYPTLNNLPYVEKQFCKVSEDISERVMCLPLFSELTDIEIQLIANCLNR